MDTPTEQGSSSWSEALKVTPFINKKKKSSVEVTTQVRRSTRSTRYAGFKPQSVSDVKKAKSKVKQRKKPEAEAGTSTSSEADKVHAPPPTDLVVIQSIGINLCGIDPSMLTPKKILQSLQEEGVNKGA